MDTNQESYYQFVGQSKMKIPQNEFVSGCTEWCQGWRSAHTPSKGPKRGKDEDIKAHKHDEPGQNDSSLQFILGMRTLAC